jgi:hypothetical protein
VIPRQAPGTYFVTAVGELSASLLSAWVETRPPGSIDTYVPSSPAGLAWVSACDAPGGAAILSSGLAVSVPLPFSFRYWGTTLPAGFSVNVSRYGFMNLDGVTTSTATPSLPDTNLPNGVVAPAINSTWALRPPGICAAVLGTAPNRRWVVQWNNRTAPITGGGVSADHEVIFNEGSNAIDFVYGPGPNRSSQGLENLTGTEAARWSLTIVDGTRIRFTPTR